MKVNYAARIRSVLKKNGKYNAGMKLLIESTATSLVTLGLCRKELSQLEATTIWEDTRYGRKLVPHPVFRTLRDAQAVLLKNCKALGLSYEEISKIADSESDPLSALRESMSE